MKTASSLIALALTVLSLRAQPQNATIDNINAALDSLISSPDGRTTALCALRSAMWGSYSVQVFVPQALTAKGQALWQSAYAKFVSGV